MGRINYSALSAADMDRAGWQHRLGARRGNMVEVRFQSPVNGEEVRIVPLWMLPDADQIKLGVRPLHAGKTERDKASATRGHTPTGHSAIPGPAKGPSPSAEQFRHNGKKGKNTK